MRVCLVIFNHNMLTFEQQESIKQLGCQNVIYLPDKFNSVWKNINPATDKIESLKEIKDFTLKNTNLYDYVLIQGEFGATYIMVNFCFENSRIPIYATSKRESIEERLADGSVIKKSVFKFVRFREYER